ncbi:MAG TPA: 4-hydroxy-tetrahydrodipicolinate reductase [Rhodothermales bacterium]|nr:4-hydroxy-tetrahydrodipicolinate reductase [Rhodothermales bacterium]
MKLALVGTGRMGQAVEAVARERGHEIVARFDHEHPLLDAHDPDVMNGAEVAVDFSVPDVALDQLHRYCLWGVDAVVGTTGWASEEAKVRDWVEEGGNAILAAPNFSLGVAVLRRALAAALPLLDRLDEYDPSVHEAHHTGKLDSPSGTALRLAEDVLAGLARKSRLEVETVHGAIAPDALHVTSVRTGHVFGEHTVSIDGPADRIILRHEAKDRRVFALGAVRAAEWLPGRAGFFSFDDMLDSWIGESGNRGI